MVDSGVVTADGLAVDWVYSHLYWTGRPAGGTDTAVIARQDYSC